MQNTIFLLIGMVCMLFFTSHAQQSQGNITGTVKDQSGEVIPNASLTIQSGPTVLSDRHGRFRFSQLPAGRYIITAYSVGYQEASQEVEVSGNQAHVVDFELEASLVAIDEVDVTGLAVHQQINRQAFHVTAIDAKQLHSNTLDLAHALDKVSGVRVRETGGVGSNFNFSLNGFSGKQVKFYLDGIPMENFGSAFQINNIPINLAERIEVYKGVVPITLGGDALGGAVNIVTNANHRNYLDISYSYGSFNTHRSAVNAGYTAKSGFTVQLNAFQNYSDNNYRVLVDILEDFNTGVTRSDWVRRFHDTYHNETVIAQIGVVDKPYADRLLIGATVGRVFAEIQTGNRMFDVYGDRFRDGNILIPTLKYNKKDLFIKGLSLNLQGNLNLGQERAVDTVFKQYSWSGIGEYKTPGHTWAPGGERSRMLYKFRNNNSSVNANFSYALNDRHTFVLNGVYSGFNRKGENVIVPEDENAKQPQIVNKTVIGLGYQYREYDRWEATAFVKQYMQDNSSSYVIDWTSYPQHSNFSGTGYGIAATYFLLPNLQVKSSYEKSYRLPEGEELFGDVVNISPNTTLEPEKSDNINIGINYNTQFNRSHFLELRGSYIYRDASGFIRPVVSTVGVAQFRYANLRDVRNNGIEGEINYSFKELFHTGVNLTYQNLRNKTKYEGSSTTVSPVYNDRIPNMPYLFGNAYASISWNDVLKSGNTLSIGYNLLYVHTFYLRWPSQGETKTGIIPKQLAHDANLMYTMKEGRYSIALEGRNLADRLLYDNFHLQKPGRAFSIKLRYYLTNNY